MEEGSKRLQRPWHAMRVNRTCEDREVGGTTKGNICSCVTFHVKLSIPVTTKEG